MKRHELIHTGKFLYSCKQCNTKFRHSSTLKRHELTHKSKSSATAAEKMIQYYCKVCKKDFAGPKTLRIHERVHSKEKNDTIEEYNNLLNS
jgi:KRAB domain-containing zinc finger protein